jgi:hypothetical protein
MDKLWFHLIFGFLVVGIKAAAGFTNIFIGLHVTSFALKG